MHSEHVALNVPDLKAMAQWKVDHRAMRVIRYADGPSQTHFVSDATAASSSSSTQTKAPNPGLRVRILWCFTWHCR